jgi:hypothetical protein
MPEEADVGTAQLQACGPCGEPPTSVERKSTTGEGRLFTLPPDTPFNRLNLDRTPGLLDSPGNIRCKMPSEFRDSLLVVRSPYFCSIPTLAIPTEKAKACSG